MSSLWLNSRKCLCVHPGWPEIQGYDAVVDSWEGILSSRPDVDIQCLRPSVDIRGDSARLVCVEMLDGGRAEVVAANQFEATSEGWKMVYHGAGLWEDPGDAAA